MNEKKYSKWRNGWRGKLTKLRKSKIGKVYKNVKISGVKGVGGWVRGEGKWMK